jgi:hypothetical protein
MIPLIDYAHKIIVYSSKHKWMHQCYLKFSRQETLIPTRLHLSIRLETEKLSVQETKTLILMEITTLSIRLPHWTNQHKTQQLLV